MSAWVFVTPEENIGDVIAEFNGHDHKNTLQVNVDGVDVVNVPTCGEAAYHSDFTRGVGLITLDEKCPRKYDYKLIQMYKLWESGETKIRWVKNNMALLRGIEEEFLRTKPFEGLRVSLSVHLEAKTAYLCRVLAVPSGGRCPIRLYL